MKHKTYKDGILYNGDCLKVMPKLIQQGIKVDAIITDVPYGTTSCQWDTIIPFESMWKNINNLIKDNGAIALFGSEPFSSHLRMSNECLFRYDWIWHKNSSGGFATAKKMPMKFHEIISVFYKKLPTYNPQFQPYSDTAFSRFKNKKISTIHSDSNFIQGIKTKERTINLERGKYPESVLTIKTVPQCNGIRVHPTQKPIELMEYLIKTYTNEGDTVLDFTCGSGSTLVACRNLNRKFIGIEKEEKYYKVCKQRLAHECKKSLF